jgi:Uma2 family endonuclease
MSLVLDVPPPDAPAPESPRPRLTADELLARPDGEQFELVDGEVRETTMSLESSWIAGELLRIIGNYLETHRLGRVFGEAASYRCFPHDPERVRKPDVSFIRHGRLTQAQFEQRHCRVAPDLAVDVVSPNDLHQDLMGRIDDYFSARVPLVWVVEPSLKLVTVYENAGRSTSMLRGDEELTGDDVLPEFRCPVSRLFPQPEPTEPVPTV